MPVYRVAIETPDVTIAQLKALIDALVNAGATIKLIQSTT